MKNFSVWDDPDGLSRRADRASVRRHEAAIDSVALKLLKQHSIDGLQQQIAALVAQRQALRTGPSTPSELEKNRLQIVQCQRELNCALIAVYGREAA